MRHIELLGEAIVQHSLAGATPQQACFVTVLQYEKSRYERLRNTMVETQPRILEIVAAAGSGELLARAMEDMQDGSRGEGGRLEESDGEDEEGIPVFEEAEYAPAYVDSGFASEGDSFGSGSDFDGADSQEGE